MGENATASFAELSAQYEVLNSSHNALRFSRDVNGIYVLRLRIVDPNYRWVPLNPKYTHRANSFELTEPFFFFFCIAKIGEQFLLGLGIKREFGLAHSNKPGPTRIPR